MADSLKVLGQLDPAATTTTVLYTVPDKTQTTVSSIVAANRTGSAITFRLSVHVAGASADDKQFLFYDKSVAANDSFSIGYRNNLKSSRCYKSKNKCSRHEL